MIQSRTTTVQSLNPCKQTSFVSEDEASRGDGEDDGENENEGQGKKEGKEKHRWLSDDLEGSENSQPLQSLLKRAPDLNLEGKIHSVSPQHRHGGYSDIFIGVLAKGEGCRVAVKKLRAPVVDDLKFQKRLAKELCIWSKLNHPRILPLEGFYIDNGGYPHLVSKWMENGTALKYLKEHPEANLLSLLTGIAEGIKYLHKIEIIHSDIKPDNVLISDSKKPLLCDLGMSRILEAAEPFSIFRTKVDVLRGTVRYMAKELFELADEKPITYSKESDVWAFGMTVFTLLTKRRPYESIIHDYQVRTAIIGGILPSWPDDCKSWPATNQCTQRICESCWKTKSVRPSMDVLTLNLCQLSPLEEKDPETANHLEKRAYEARQESNTSLIVANLKARVSNWKGVDISNAGQVILEDIITATRPGIERELHAYLFETSIMMFATKEDGIMKEKSNKSNWIPFASRKKLTSPPRVSKDLDSSEQKSCLLDLKGRILLTHITHIRRHALPDAPYLLQVWLLGNDDREFVSIKCRSEKQMEKWEDAINDLIEWTRTKRTEYRGIQQQRKTDSCNIM